MSRQRYSIEIVKQIIIAHQRLFVEVYLIDSPEMQGILHQMIHSKLHHKSIKLYQYLVEAFLLSGGGNQSNHGYYATQNHKPTFNRVKRAVKTAQCPKLATFETFKGCGYRKITKKCNEPAFLSTCPLPTFDMKRGNLNHMAFSLYFSLRDVCGSDFYTFAKQHFGDHLPADGAITDLLQSFIEKITTIANVGPKLAHLGAVGSNIAKQASEFDPRNYGFSKLGELVKATELFEVKIKGDGPSKAIYICNKRKKPKE